MTTNFIKAFFLFAFSMQVQATVIDLSTADSIEDADCSIASVTGNDGGATSCYGLFADNDNHGQYNIGSDTFSWLGGSDDGSISFTGISNTPFGDLISGTWALAQDTINSFTGDFFIVLKSGNRFSSYLFSGDDNTSTGGTWATSDFRNSQEVVQGISHFDIYAANPTAVPEPSIIALLGMGLFGLGLARRKMK